MSGSGRVRMQAVEEGASVTPLELFFDLVFVFALTQVTAFMSADLSGRGLFRGLLILCLLWWSWVGYAWLFNVVQADEGSARVVVLVAMTAMFVLALTIPEAFDDGPGGLPGPVVLALCYFGFRALHLALFWIISGEDQGLRRQVIRFAPSVLGGTALLLAASQFRGTLQTGLWVAALLADYGGTLLAGASGWRLRSARHFAERHGLILIIALGESIVAIGVGMAQLPVSWAIIAAAFLGLVIAAALWWAYFDVVAPLAERALDELEGEPRARLARDAYSYLHLPLVAGVVLLALGLKKLLEYVGDARHHDLAEPLTGLGLYALYGGVAGYLLAHVAFAWRSIHKLKAVRLVGVVVVLVLLPVGAHLPALAALALLAVALVCLLGWETARHAEDRDAVRHPRAQEPA